MAAVFTGTAAARLPFRPRPSVDWQPAAETSNRLPRTRAHAPRTLPGLSIDEVIIRSFRHPGVVVRTPIRDLDYAGCGLDVYRAGVTLVFGPSLGGIVASFPDLTRTRRARLPAGGVVGHL